MTADKSSLADRLVRVRTERGLTQAQTAEQLGVRRQLLAGWEHGARPPQVRHAATIAAFLDMTPEAVRDAARANESAERIGDLERQVAALRRRVRELENASRPAVAGTDANRGLWLGVPEVAEVLGVMKKTVYRFIDHDGLPAHRFGRVIRVRRSDLEKWAETQQVNPGTLAHLYPCSQRPEEADPG